MTRRGLPPGAYEKIDGAKYEPYVPMTESPREFTIRAATTGIIFGVLFGAANAYLGLRVGLTISTSIPIAVLTVLAFLTLPPFGRIRSILEANMSQTIGSASSSLASGMIFTIPALYMWGREPSLLKLIVIAASGGLLGILFMIPLRKFLIKGEHGNLPYPEGTACAEVLVAADRGGSDSMPIFYGILVGGFFKILTSGLHLLKHSFTFKIPFLPKGQLGLEAGPALLGVGYILGFRIATVMVGGGLLSSLVIIPAIAIWGAERGTPLYPETVNLISEMSAGQIWTRYVRYIGAGAVAAAGIIALIRSIPMIIESFRVGIRHLRDGGKGENEERTDHDLSMVFVLAAVAVIVILLAVAPHVTGFLPSYVGRFVSALLIAIFAFFFVTVSSRIVGLVGVTSNPTSGMTIATLLGVSGVFLLFRWTGPEGMAQALVIGSVVATAASIAGDTSQDLKTGFLLGATPRRQQIGEIIGVVTSVTGVCLAVVALQKAYGFGTQELPAPQATLMKIVIEGVLTQEIPWVFVGIGMVISVIAWALKISPLAFAVGVYIPVATFVPVFIGGLIRRYVENKSKNDRHALEVRRERGILFGSGLVGGEGLVGVGIAVFALVAGRRPHGFGPEWAGGLIEWVPLFGFAILAWILYRMTRVPEKK